MSAVPHARIIHAGPSGLTQRLSLRGRLSMWLVGGMLVVMLLLGVGVVYFVHRAEAAAWQGRQAEAVDHATSTVSAFVEHVRDTLASAAAIDQAELRYDYNEFEGLFQRDAALLELVRFDVAGQVVTSAHRDQAVLAGQAAVTQSVWFQTARRGQAYTSPVEFAAHDTPYMIFALPASDGGVVAARVQLDVFAQVVADQRFGTTGHVYVIDQAGLLLAHSDAAADMGQATLAGRPEFVAIMAAPDHRWQGEHDDLRGDRVVSVSAAVPATDWIVITTLPLTEAYATTRQAGLLLTISLISLGGLALAIFSWRFDRLIFGPIERLRDGTRRFGQGELTVRLNLPRHDEIGQVAATFNEMADRLQDREEQLRRLNAELENRVAARTAELDDVNGQLRREISGHQRALAAWQASETFFHSLAEAIPQHLARKDLAGRFTYANRRFCDELNLSQAELIGQTDYDIHPPELAEKYRADDQRVIASGQVFETREERVLLNGETTYVHTVKSPVYDETGQSIGIQIMFWDVTERQRLETAVRQSRQNLQTLLDNFPFLVWLKDEAGRFMAINQPFAQACGRASHTELVGLTDLDVWPRELAEGYRADDDEVMRRRQQKHAEELVNDRGVDRWHETYKAPLVDAQGRVIGTTGFARDITERKLAEEALRQSEEKFRKLIDLSPDAIVLVDMALNFVLLNRQAEDLFGLSSADEVLGRSVRCLIAPEYQSSLTNDLAAILQTGVLPNVQYDCLRANGARFPAEGSVSVLTDGSGQPIGFIDIVRDITARKQAEAAVRASEERYRQLYMTERRQAQELTLLDNVRTALMRQLDLAAVIRDIIQAIEANFGYQHLSVYFVEGEWLVLQDQTGYDRPIARIPLDHGITGRAARTGRAILIPDVRRDPDFLAATNNVRSEICTPIVDQGQVVGVLNVETTDQTKLDETDLKLIEALSEHLSIAIGHARLYAQAQQELAERQRAEAALERYAAELETRVAERTQELTAANLRLTDLDKMKDQFMSRINHELRTPLSTIKIYLELLTNGKPEKHAKYLATIQTAADRLHHLIEDLLNYNELTRLIADLRLEAVSLNPLVSALVNDQQATAQARGLALAVDLADDLPLAQGESTLISEALRRILTNALQYTSTGSITIATGYRERADKPWVTLTVHDTGPGLSAEDQAHLFERFYRGAAASDYKTPGTGLGLAMSLDMMRALGGDITVESDWGCGTVFTLWLPVAAQARAKE